MSPTLQRGISPISVAGTSPVTSPLSFFGLAQGSADTNTSPTPSPSAATSGDALWQTRRASGSVGVGHVGLWAWTLLPTGGKQAWILQSILPGKSGNMVIMAKHAVRGRVCADMVRIFASVFVILCLLFGFDLMMQGKNRKPRQVGHFFCLFCCFLWLEGCCGNYI